MLVTWLRILSLTHTFSFFMQQIFIERWLRAGHLCPFREWGKGREAEIPGGLHMLTRRQKINNINEQNAEQLEEFKRTLTGWCQGWVWVWGQRRRGRDPS